MKKTKKKIKKSRSAKTGRYVTKKYAKCHPKTTVTESENGQCI